MTHYERYFNRGYTQHGSGIGEIGHLYKSSSHIQRGRGLSNVFSGILRFLSPYLIKSGKAIGEEALRSGTEIVVNLGTDSLGNLFKKQGVKSAANLSEKVGNELKRVGSQMNGEGIKRRRRSASKASKRSK